MQQQEIMNLLLYDITQHRAPQGMAATENVITEVIDGWNHNKYVFPQYPIKFNRPRRQKTYHLM